MGIQYRDCCQDLNQILTFKKYHPLAYPNDSVDFLSYFVDNFSSDSHMKSPGARLALGDSDWAMLTRFLKNGNGANTVFLSQRYCRKIFQNRRMFLKAYVGCIFTRFRSLD